MTPFVNVCRGNGAHADRRQAVSHGFSRSDAHFRSDLNFRFRIFPHVRRSQIVGRIEYPVAFSFLATQSPGEWRTFLLLSKALALRFLRCGIEIAGGAQVIVGPCSRGFILRPLPTLDAIANARPDTPTGRFFRYRLGLARNSRGCCEARDLLEPLPCEVVSRQLHRTGVCTATAGMGHGETNRHPPSNHRSAAVLPATDQRRRSSAILASCQKATKAEPVRSLTTQGFPRCPLWPTALSSLRLGAA